MSDAQQLIMHHAGYVEMTHDKTDYLERVLFCMERSCGLQPSPTINYLVTSLLATDDGLEVLRVNPFCQEVLHSHVFSNHSITVWIYR